MAIVALWLEWWLYYTARERQRVEEAVEPSGEPPLAAFDLEPEEEEKTVFRNSNFVGR